ncbi:hypothetical protein OQA88_9105 [Cercophora sp. LCS_1]
MDVLKVLALPEGPRQRFLTIDSSPSLAPSQQLQLAVEDDRVAVHAPDSALALLDPASTTHLSGCIRCRKPGVASCSGCYAARYCSRECQVADRPYHKRLCGQQARFGEANRPSPRHIRCVFMAVGQPGPDFIWVEFDAKGCVSRSDLETLGYRSADILLVQINREGTTHKPPYFTAFMFPKNELTEPVNKAYLRIMAPRPGQIFPRRGSGVYMAFSAPTTQQQACQPRDVTMFDWNEAVIFSQTDASTPMVIDPGRFIGPAVPCIKLNCHGDCARYQIATMEKGTTPVEGQCLLKLYHWVSPYTVMLQLPWVSRWVFMNLDLVTTSRDPKAAQKNDQATFLDACVKFCPSTGVVDHIVHERFGGTQVLFHTAGAEVHPHHLTAFNRFLARIIPAEQNRISHIAAGPGDITLAELRSRATKTEFASFWEEYVAGLDRETDNDDIPASPYDVTPGLHAQEAGTHGAEDRAKIEAAWRGINERPEEQQSEEQQSERREMAARIAAELAELLPGVHVVVNTHP